MLIARFLLKSWQAGNDVTEQNVARIEADSKKALELDPRNAKGNYYLGKVLAFRGCLDEAITSLQRAYDILPPFKDDVQKALRVCRKQRWIRDRVKRHGEATEAYSTISKLLEGARVSMGEEVYQQISKDLHSRYRDDLQINDSMEIEYEVPEHLQCKISWAPLLDPVITPGHAIA